MPSARALIRKLGLEPHPEGGFYREIFRSQGAVVTSRGRRAGVTSIYFLLLAGQRSLFHRVAADEIWHHYQGAPLRLLRVSPDLEERAAIPLGPLRGRREPVAVIPAGHWQAAESRGEFTLVGCTVGPGFDFRDFTMLRDEAAAARKLRARHPALAGFI